MGVPMPRARWIALHVAAKSSISVSSPSVDRPSTRTLPLVASEVLEGLRARDEAAEARVAAPHARRDESASAAQTAAAATSNGPAASPT